MAIDLTVEKEAELSAQDRYDIISAAVADAYDDGFMNGFIFERALYSYAFAAFSETDELTRKELFLQIHENPLTYWTEHLDDIEKMVQEHAPVIGLLGTDANMWFADYVNYAYSMRGLLDNLGDIMSGVTQRAQNELVEMQQDGELQSVMDIAKEWGFDRVPTNESLFDQ